MKRKGEKTSCSAFWLSFPLNFKRENLASIMYFIFTFICNANDVKIKKINCTWYILLYSVDHRGMCYSGQPILIPAMQCNKPTLRRIAVEFGQWLTLFSVSSVWPSVGGRSLVSRAVPDNREESLFHLPETDPRPSITDLQETSRHSNERTTLAAE